MSLFYKIKAVLAILAKIEYDNFMVEQTGNPTTYQELLQKQAVFAEKSPSYESWLNQTDKMNLKQVLALADNDEAVMVMDKIVAQLNQQLESGENLDAQAVIRKNRAEAVLIASQYLQETHDPLARQNYLNILMEKIRLDGQADLILSMTANKIKWPADGAEGLKNKAASNSEQKPGLIGFLSRLFVGKK